MTPEAKRIAILEATGWKRMTVGGQESPTGQYWKSPGGRIDVTPPDCLNDLNAMHEAQKTLGQEWDNYWRNLFKIINQDNPSLACDKRMQDLLWYYCINATAAQRCEAFLRTIGKWVE